ncbi:myo-inositol 2-dehydrogenase/D-chiro-inositol 1-dehydrogenase [Kineosphaera limosa]|uniref:Myo-inositol 2-dehydrogenase n=1 Tax=Kineosphaera limosa NBRC 100340 TaxID=1184609 RepID=K6WTQ4_9MICO|nr:inositol 2-dehydrogenase [Kineosphaera limosa]NYE01089.1 myo-inositol 2-dehydrogenase/D-chiro-inositol 1-dehydrogenase [Kineosphaera limosa]GAB97236.1 myo-inositol 2-dehydrogenase [Kineosphaera limosa NBRC 100340]
MLSIGLLGCGRIGRVHADSIATNPRAHLARVYDPFEQAASAVGARFGAQTTTDVDDIIGDPGIDAVVIASPTPTHIDLLTAAVEAGKAVLCEKPIDLDVALVDACAQRIDDLAGRVMLGFNRRFDPSFADIHARVAAGQLGPLEQLTIISRDPAPPPAAYVATSGGLFKDMTIHDFDMARFFLGDVVEVTATGSNLVSPEIEAAGDIDGAVVVLRGVNGAVATIINSRRAAFGYDQRLEAFGELGMLRAENQLPTSVTFSGATSTQVAPPYYNFFLDRYTPAYRAELDAFITGVEAGTGFSPSFADGRAALVLAQAADESVRTGATVAVPGPDLDAPVTP